jgi:hypothetical protein
MKLMKMLYEIGEGSSKPFDYRTQLKRRVIQVRGGTDTETITEKWSYSIDAYIEKDNQREPVDIILEIHRFDMRPNGIDRVVLMIDFHRDDQMWDLHSTKYERVNSREYMFRLMSTIMKIIKKEVADDLDINTLAYYPVDDDRKAGATDMAHSQRHKLYQAYIKKAFPGAKQVQISPAVIAYRVRD